MTLMIRSGEVCPSNALAPIVAPSQEIPIDGLPTDGISSIVSSRFVSVGAVPHDPLECRR